MNQLPKIIQQMNEEDLQKLRKDLISGNLEKLINERLQQLRGINDKACPVCGSSIENDDFILEFGSEQLRKRAYFDERDCLKYFLDERINH